MKRTVLFVLVIAALLLSACGAGGTAGHYDAIKKAGVIKVGTSADYPPFEYTDASGAKLGFDIDLMAALAAKMGLKVEWVDMPFDSLIAGVKEGKIDAAISCINYSEERDKQVDFTDPYYTLEDSFLVADGFKGEIKSETDVAKYKVGVQTGTMQDTWLTDTLVTPGKLPQANLTRYDRADQAALDLKAGRIDVLMIDSAPGDFLTKQVGGLKVAYKALLSSGPLNIAIPDKDTDLGKALNDAIKALKADGTVDKLVQKYLVTQ